MDVIVRRWVEDIFDTGILFDRCIDNLEWCELWLINFKFEDISL
jgi:hypothetical protein